AVSRDALSATTETDEKLVRQGGLGRLDGDHAGLLLLRDLALQLDGEQAVGELGALDLDVVGELEAALEVAAGDATVEELLLLGGRCGLARGQGARSPLGAV